jgi:hypothetical protein
MRLCGFVLFVTAILIGPTAIAGPATQPADSAAKSLFDGKTLTNWKQADYGGGDEPRVENGNIVIPAGERLSGIVWDGVVLPKNNFEISLQAMRVDGFDFFCGLTFPVDDSFATLVLGGWGGALCGISSLDGEDAAHNSTKSYHRFDTGKWYHVRVRVTPGKLQAWVEDEKIVDVSTVGKKIGLRDEISPSTPLGIATFQTQAEVRDIQLKRIDATTKPSK